MTTQNTPKITHEADTQRQHVRVPLPANIIVNNKAYDLKDWSVAGASIVAKNAGDMQHFQMSSKHEAILAFTMDEFNLHIPMTIKVQHPDQAKNLIGIQYADMTPRQISLMQELVNSYVSGEIATANDIIHVVGRNNFVKPRELPKASKQTPQQKLSLALRKTALIAASVLLFSFLLFSIYERNFIVTAENAYIDANGFAVEANTGGVIHFNDIHRGDRVKKGDVIMTIKSSSGAVRGIDSPCDCIVNQKLVKTGNRVNQGDKILRLVPVGTKMFVDAFIHYEDAVDIKEGQSVDIALDGSDLHLDGVIEDISSVSIGKGKYEVRIRSEEPLPEHLLGTPANVSIDTLGLWH